MYYINMYQLAGLGASILGILMAQSQVTIGNSIVTFGIVGFVLIAIGFTVLVVYDSA